MGSPKRFLEESSGPRIRAAFAGFRHRFTPGEELSAMLVGAKRVLAKYGSLRACFLRGLHEKDTTVLPALSAFVDELSPRSRRRKFYLVPSPERGSACKRLHLFLRWMVRQDAVDPGGWREVPPSKLVVPLDTHMHRICTALNFTRRKQANAKAAAEITGVFRSIAPEDPVRYDFALTRLGMRRDGSMPAIIRQCTKTGGLSHG
jgi:uncharacterized protein (TIGR02757 family)